MSQTGRILVLFIVLMGSLVWATDAPKTSAPATKDISIDMVAQIKVGTATMDQVTELWGAPLRVMNDLDCHVEGYQGETWEYIGHDASGSVKIDVQFDREGIARLIAKSAAKGPVVVLASAPLTSHSHMH